MVSASPLKEWRVHLGAHKTATTHIQDTLEAVRTQLAAVGVEYVPRQEIRDQGGFEYSQLWQRQSFFQRIFKSKVRKEHWIKSYEQKQDILLISEENLLGGVSGLLTSPLYPKLEKNLRLLSILKNNSKIQLFMATRSFDTLLPSAYGQQARMGKARQGAFDIVKKAALKNPPRWSQVVERIIEVFDVSQLKIWKYEDYKDHRQQVLALLCANRLVSFPHIPPPVSTRSPSAEAIAYLEKISSSLPKHRKKATGSQVCLEDTGKGVYQPFSPGEIAMLRASYCEDLLMLEKKYPGLFITFPAD